jgi:hypothetical protein
MELLGAIVLEDPKLRFVQVEVECDVVDGGSGHRELHIKTLDLAKREQEAELRAASASAAPN